jgi:hypothetical protein
MDIFTAWSGIIQRTKRPPNPSRERGRNLNKNMESSKTLTQGGLGFGAPSGSTLDDVAAKYMVGYDLAPPNGDRPALAVGLTREQFTATQRASCPPGDKQGAEILKDIDRLRKAFLRNNPNGVSSVFILSNVHRSESTPKKG